MSPKMPPIEVRRTLFDRMAETISPAWGAKRYLQRVQQATMERYAATLGYVGGRTDRKSMQEWLPSAGSADADILDQHGTLRARSRDLVRNSPIAAGAVGTKESHVVGKGLRLSSEVDGEFLGLSEEETRARQGQLERLWLAVKDRLEWEGDCQDADLQALVFRAVLESGDLLVVRRRRKDEGDLIGTKVQLIEADRVSNPHGAMDRPDLAGGVESRAGRTIAYHVQNTHPGETYAAMDWSWQRVPKYGQGGLPLSRLIFAKKRPGQRRGVPLLAPVMEPLKQITRLTDHELMSSVVSAMFTIFVESEDPATGQLPVAPVGVNVPDNAGEIFMPGGGSVIDLKPGEKIHTADPNRPNGAFAPFFSALVEQIGMAIGEPYEVLMKRFNNSYSASRAALLEFYLEVMRERKFLADHYLNLVWEWVVYDAVVSGVIDLPGFLTDRMARRAWLQASWVGAAQSQINPKDDVMAARLRIDAGLSTRKHETAALLGLDWDKDVQPQREREKTILEEADMAFATDPKSEAGVGSPDDSQGMSDGAATPDDGEPPPPPSEEEEAA